MSMNDGLVCTRKLSYEEARAYIQTLSSYGSVLGLDSIRELLKRLGNPQDLLTFIHVGGTNGKGSTSAYITSILVEAGYFVGRYISPVVRCYEECIQFSYTSSKKPVETKTDYVEQERIASYISTIREVCNQMVEEGLPHPTPFEVETAMAMLAFVEKKCDYVVLEVGLGGRLDATNVIETVALSIITSISMDHMQFLGNTLEEIAYEKAGIIKRHVPVVSYEQEPTVRDVIEKTCDTMETQLVEIRKEDVKQIHATLEGTTFLYEAKEVEGKEEPFYIPLLGEHQIYNGILAIQAAYALKRQGLHITEDHIRLGLANTTWIGRFSILGKTPTLIVDGAHNMDAAVWLSKSLSHYFKEKKGIFLIGVLADKEYEEIVRLTAPFAKKFITITPNNGRALPSDELAKVVRKFCRDVTDGKTVREGLRIARQHATEEDFILCYGSLSFLGEIMEELNI